MWQSPHVDHEYIMCGINNTLCCFHLVALIFQWILLFHFSTSQLYGLICDHCGPSGHYHHSLYHQDHQVKLNRQETHVVVFNKNWLFCACQGIVYI